MKLTSLLQLVNKLQPVGKIENLQQGSLFCHISGSNHLYYLVNPKNSEKSEGSPEEVDWNYAQKEMAEATGFQTGFGSGLSKGISSFFLCRTCISRL